MKIISLICALSLTVVTATMALAAKNVVNPSVAVKTEYSDNLLLSRHNAESDFITTVSPGVRMVHETERYKASFDAKLDALSYADHNDLNAIEHDYKGDLTYAVSPLLKLDFGAGYSRDYRSGRDIDVSGLVLGTSKRENKNFTGSAQYTFDEKSAGSLSYQYFKSDNDDPAYSDYYSHNLSAGFMRDLSDYWSNAVGLANIGYNHYEYTSATLDNYSLTLGIKKRITELYSWRLNVGPRHTRTDFHIAGLKSDEWGIKLDASLMYEGEKLNSSLSYSQDLNNGTTSLVGTSNKTSIAVDVKYHFVAEWTAVFNANYHLNKSDGGKLSLYGQDEKTININPALRYRIDRDLYLAASYKYTSVKDDLANTRAERNLVFATVNWRWPLMD